MQSLIKKEINTVFISTIIPSVFLGALFIFFAFKEDINYFFPVSFLVLFCVIPIVVPFLLTHMSPKFYDRMIKHIKKDTSLSAHVLCSTEISRSIFYIFFVFSVIFLVLILPIAILLLITQAPLAGFRALFFSITLLWVATAAAFLHYAYVKAFMGYSGSMPSFRNASKEKTYLEGLDEARFYLVISRDYIKKNHSDWIVPFKNSLFALDESLRKRKKLKISNLENIFQVHYKMRKIDPSLDREIMLDFTNKLISAIDRRKIDEIGSTLLDFFEKPELQYLKEFKPPAKINFKKIITPLTTVIVSAIVLLLALFPQSSEQIQQIIATQRLQITLLFLYLATIAAASTVMLRILPPDPETIRILRESSKKGP